jgi:hypothetical protein
MSEYDSLKFLPRNVETCFFQQKALSVALSFLLATSMWKFGINKNNGWGPSQETVEKSVESWHG